MRFHADLASLPRPMMLPSGLMEVEFARLDYPVKYGTELLTIHQRQDRNTPIHYLILRVLLYGEGYRVLSDQTRSGCLPKHRSMVECL